MHRKSASENESSAPKTDWLRVTIEGIQKDVAEIKEEVKSLSKARWLHEGKSGAIAAVVAFLVTLLGIYLSKV